MPIDLEDRMRVMEARMALVETSNAVNGVQKSNVEVRLSAIEDTLRWLVRLIIGTLILAVIGFAIKGGFRV